MCGIFGVITKNNTEIKPEKIRAITDSLFKLSESRGKEAAGIAIKTKDSVTVLKKPLAASKMIKSEEYKSFISGKINHSPLTIIGHSRLVTNGLQTTADNNQPVDKGGVIAIHNGIIVNDKELFDKFPQLQKLYDVDTEIFLDLVQHFYKITGSVSKAVQETYKQIEGSASIGLIFKNYPHLVLATNTGSLYFCKNSENKIIVFASEKRILQQLIKKENLNDFLDPRNINQIKPRTGKVINTNNLETEILTFEIKQNYESFKYNEVIEKNSSILNSELKRCNKCILPETFPFIEFDDNGTCNYCRSYKKQEVKGTNELEKIITKYRSENGGPDCIVAFSGGRDSSYGLHYIKNVLKMNPVAFTYDWGMVTDLARRNQARICGKLGIEHILISSDISRKRNNIKKNVLAWLKKPNLGTIPLFMAGDKKYFYYLNKLRKQMNIKLIIYSENPLERTDFKSGFCGAKPSLRHGHLYNIGIVNKIKIALYYFKQFVKNPAYINFSIIDTLWAYIASYYTAHEYLYLFQYINWDENEINHALINNYDWETAIDTKSTWRIGDGTAPFYNYIYYAVAGFTENDTFRSNQIREGIITREQALNFIETENLPRHEGLKWYTDQIEINMEKTLEIIDSIPKLYKKK